METQKKNPFIAIKEFSAKCARVFRVARKPTASELKQVSKVSALGLLIIGLIGFVISMAFIFLR